MDLLWAEGGLGGPASSNRSDIMNYTHSGSWQPCLLSSDLQRLRSDLKLGCGVFLKFLSPGDRGKRYVAQRQSKAITLKPKEHSPLSLGVLGN